MDYLISGVLGLLTGSLVYSYMYSSIFPPLAKIASYGSVTLPDLWNVNPFLLIAVFVALSLLLFYFLEHGPQRTDKLK